MSKKVNFGDPYSGGSRRGNGHGHRRSDDSGVGSSTDYDSRGSHPDRAFPAADRESQRYNITALQEALANAIEDRDEWKAKAYDLDSSLAKKNSELKESEARGRALIDRNEILEQEKNAVRREKKSLAEDNEDLRAQVKRLTKELDQAKHKIEKLSSTPSPPPNASRSTPHDTFKRRNSVSASKNQPKERPHKEEDRDVASKEKLAQRFKSPEERRADDSDRSGGSSNKSHRTSRRQSYIEPMGPAERRPIPAPIPPSPNTNRQFPGYSTTPQYSTQYANMQDPSVGRVPRAIRPSVTAVYDESAVYDDFDDGNYHAYPLPGHR